MLQQHLNHYSLLEMILGFHKAPSQHWGPLLLLIVTLKQLNGNLVVLQRRCYLHSFGHQSVKVQRSGHTATLLQRRLD